MLRFKVVGANVDVQTVARAAYPHSDQRQFNLAVALLAERVGLWWEFNTDPAVKIVGLPPAKKEQVDP